ncbi:hypothetical protein ETH_00011315 [Eimeria tenella]|uniref:Uncharacterized protein n=1 Tax=Eimeria tenella TaxID=5802 RepID=U6KVC5_EIMTE|nr:hypothetical protein ETH_00011315 [Eimeria tenella]CDJ42082.1 hypothetical protein ETH_00011315 [Eimeria tenella]|eukprot:XP_013232832.1 hypothetical protein ETH_00011315 [Eimeria tenella]
MLLFMLAGLLGLASSGDKRRGAEQKSPYMDQITGQQHQQKPVQSNQAGFTEGDMGPWVALHHPLPVMPQQHRGMQQQQQRKKQEEQQKQQR